MTGKSTLFCNYKVDPKWMKTGIAVFTGGKTVNTIPKHGHFQLESASLSNIKIRRMKRIRKIQFNHIGSIGSTGVYSVPISMKRYMTRSPQINSERSRQKSMRSVLFKTLKGQGQAYFLLWNNRRYTITPARGRGWWDGGPHGDETAYLRSSSDLTARNAVLQHHYL